MTERIVNKSLAVALTILTVASPAPLQVAGENAIAGARAEETRATR